MISLRKLSILVLVVSAAGCRCGTNELLDASSDLQVRPERLNFGSVWVGHRAVQKLELQNSGRMSLSVTLSVDAPFDVPTTLTLGGGESQEVDVGLLATQARSFRGTVSVTWGNNTREVAVEGVAVAPPECPSQDCRTFAFDPATGLCVESVATDGTSCGTTNQCIVSGVCMSGQCVGQARDCDDHDACTSDACDAATGCLHDAVACPGSSDPCVVPVCDSATGCGLAPAADGVTCGTNDCVTAHVCIGGQCVTRPAPDGSQCKAPTSCRGAGLCRNQACQLPQANVLSPAWRYDPPVDHDLSFLGHVDSQGNIYATESWVGAPMGQANGGEDRTGLSDCLPTADGGSCGAPFIPNVPITAIVSFTPGGVLRFKVEVTQGCVNCTYGHFFAIDSAGHRLFFTSMGETQARSTDDGRLLWRITPTAGLPAYDVRSDGGAAFSSSAPLLIGSDGVGIPIIEGVGDHHSYVQVFDRATGAFRWQFHRKGHLYGTGVAGTGELWTSSANCWAVAGEMARVNGAGVTQVAQFVQWIPASYGPDYALGTTGGTLHLLNDSLQLADIGMQTGAGPGSVGLHRADGELVLWDGQQRRLSSHRGLPVRPTFPVFSTEYEFNGVLGNGPEFELLTDGGVGWTSQGTDGGFIGAVNARGAELFQCPVAGSVDSTTAIAKGRAFMESGGGIVAYDVPVDVEPNGWVSRNGSLGRGGPAR
ncbi:MAG: hypothetical protein QM817_25515 [Archangium sp.]